MIKLAWVLGLDTSNYTTSAAVYNTDNHKYIHRRKLLPVVDGALGLRQSDAVFSHVRQLPQVIEELFFDAHINDITAVGISSRPRDEEGSYMPCFLVGEAVGRSVALTHKAHVYTFSHQAGHMAAALLSIDRLDLMEDEFLALHVSGGTTDVLHVTPDPTKVLSVSMLASSLDIKAGQAVDRVGGMLGLPFPAGKALDALSLDCKENKFPHKPALRDGNCCLSGIENICENMLKNGESSAKIARCCLEFLGKSLEGMLLHAKNRYPNLPVVCCGGVMANTLIRKRLSAIDGVIFSQVELSSDNACGAAVLAGYAHKIYGGE